MKVAIQRPRVLSHPVDSLSRGLPLWVNEVFEVSLKPIEGNSRAFVLERIQSTGKALSAESCELPFLHKGFFDCHLHSIWMGLRMADLDLQDCTRLDDIVFQVSRRIQAGARFVRGHGWDESKLSSTLTALPRYLDQKLPQEIPILLYRNCGHSAFANKELRKMAGLASDGASESASLITDRHLHQVGDVLPLPSIEDCKLAFLHSQDRLIREGVTSISEMSMDETMFYALKEIVDEGKLLIDVQGVFDAGRAPSIENHGPIELYNALEIGPLDRKAVLSVRHWKKYLDGSFGSRTAWLTQSYDDSESFGESLFKIDQVIQEARMALENGFYLSFHTIGDAALDQALAVADHLEDLMSSRLHTDKAMGLAPTKHRIEHAQLIREDQIDRLERQGFWMLCMQPGHRIADQHFIEQRLGKARSYRDAYRLASLLERGVPVGLSSDAPIDTFEAGKILGAAASHPNPRESVGLAEALWWYTTGSRNTLGMGAGILKEGSTVFLTDLQFEGIKNNPS